MRFWEIVNREIKKQHIKQAWIAGQAGINYGRLDYP
jgi:Ethanolamine utilization protein EutJ (predicted chaperonin)